MKKRYLIVVVGPTAVGKTDLCIQLAQRLECDIISADSRQVYQRMDIGTAKPTAEERAAAPHHLIDFVPLSKHYTAADFEEDALSVLERAWEKSPYALLTGGSGLYIDAVCRGMIPLPSIPAPIKKALSYTYEKEGIEELLAELAEKDPSYHAMVDRKNPRRILHALAVIRATGKPYSYFRHQKHGERPFRVIKIGLLRERRELLLRIDQRITQMLQQGLLEEVKSLYPYRDYKALQTIGYQEFFPYIEGKATYEEALERLRIHTRQYAKRQMTWFRKDSTIRWFAPQEHLSLLQYLEKELDLIP